MLGALRRGPERRAGSPNRTLIELMGRGQRSAVESYLVAKHLLKRPQVASGTLFRRLSNLFRLIFAYLLRIKPLFLVVLSYLYFLQ